MKRKMQLIWYLLVIAGIVAMDQVSKWLVVRHIPLHGQVEAVPGLFHLTYAQNTGAAFSVFQGMQWLFALVFLAFTAMVLYAYFRKPLPFTPLEGWCIAVIYAGGLGNMVDRLRLGYVVDMIEVEFIHFPVFNVADSFITCGCILLFIHLVFFNRAFWREDKK